MTACRTRPPETTMQNSSRSPRAPLPPATAAPPRWTRTERAPSCTPLLPILTTSRTRGAARKEDMRPRQGMPGLQGGAASSWRPCRRWQDRQRGRGSQGNPTYGPKRQNTRTGAGGRQEHKKPWRPEARRIRTAPRGQSDHAKQQRQPSANTIRQPQPRGNLERQQQPKARPNPGDPQSHGRARPSPAERTPRRTPHPTPSAGSSSGTGCKAVQRRSGRAAPAAALHSMLRWHQRA